MKGLISLFVVLPYLVGSRKLGCRYIFYPLLRFVIANKPIDITLTCPVIKDLHIRLY